MSPHAPYCVPDVVYLLGTRVLPAEIGEQFGFIFVCFPLVSEAGTHIAQSGLNFELLIHLSLSPVVRSVCVPACLTPKTIWVTNSHPKNSAYSGLHMVSGGRHV